MARESNPDGRSPELKRISSKVLEAEFFLRRLKECTSFEETRYFLSAFLTSARSIRDVINSCYARKEGFKDWWVEEKKAFRHPAMSYLDEERNLGVHQGKTGMKQKIYVTSRVEVPAYDTVEVSFLGKDIHDPSKYTVRSHNTPDFAPKASFEVKHQWQFEKFPEVQGIELCDQYFEAIRALAGKAVQSFEKPSVK